MGLKGKEVDRLEWWFKKQEMRQQRLRKWQLKLEVCAAKAREPQDASWTPCASYSSQTLFWMPPCNSKGRRAEGHRTEKMDVWVQDIRDRHQVEKEHLLAALQRAFWEWMEPWVFLSMHTDILEVELVRLHSQALNAPAQKKWSNDNRIFCLFLWRYYIWNVGCPIRV